MNVANVMSGVAVLAWVVAVGIIVFVVLQSSRGKPVRRASTMITVGILVAILFSMSSAGVVFINPQERGVVISAVSSTGYRDKALEPGLKWIIPYFESVVIYPVSMQTYTMSIAPSEGAVIGDDSIEARTADGQKVLVDASVIFSIDPAQVVFVHITWQDRYTNDLVRAMSRGVIRDAVAQYGIEEVYSTKRQELIDDITVVMDQKMTENGLLLSDFILRNITFSEEYAASVEQKQIAEQQAQQASFVVEQKRQEAEQARQIAQGKADAAVIEAQGNADARIIEAEAEAEALKLIANVIRNNDELLTYQYIEKLTPTIDTMLLPSDSPFLFPLPEANP